MNNAETENWIYVGDAIMEKIRDCKLNASALKVWMYLERNKDFAKGVLYGSDIQEIADFWGISRRGVYRAISDLIDAELYSPVGRRENRSTGKPYQKDVYFIQGCHTKYIKIGISYDVERRLKGIQASEPLKLLAVVKEGGTALEKELHKRFEQFRIHNEWFQPAPELMQYIKGIISEGSPFSSFLSQVQEKKVKQGKER